METETKKRIIFALLEEERITQTNASKADLKLITMLNELLKHLNKEE